MTLSSAVWTVRALKEHGERWRSLVSVGCWSGAMHAALSVTLDCYALLGPVNPELHAALLVLLQYAEVEFCASQGVHPLRTTMSTLAFALSAEALLRFFEAEQPAETPEADAAAVEQLTAAIFKVRW